MSDIDTDGGERRCRVCRLYTSRLEAEHRRFNVGRCACGGSLDVVMHRDRNPVTPETLTDEMIREEWSACLDRGDRDGARIAQLAIGLWPGSHTWEPSDTDLTPACKACMAHPHDGLHIDVARQHICDAINARNGAKP